MSTLVLLAQPVKPRKVTSKKQPTIIFLNIVIQPIKIHIYLKQTNQFNSYLPISYVALYLNSVKFFRQV